MRVHSPLVGVYGPSLFYMVPLNVCQNGEFGLDFKVVIKTVRGVIWKTEI